MVALQEDEGDIPSVTSAMRSSFRKCGFRRLVGPVHEEFHILQVAESEAGDESSRDILWKKLKMKLDTWTILRMKNSTAQRILMMLPETLLSEMILWKLFMKDLGAEIKEDSLPNVTSEM